jgi:hypothetical protein
LKASSFGIGMFWKISERKFLSDIVKFSSHCGAKYSSNCGSDSGFFRNGSENQMRHSL